LLEGACARLAPAHKSEAKEAAAIVLRIFMRTPVFQPAK
jgi:hypothetical protein